MKTQDEVINDYLERHTPFGPAIRSELSGIWNNGYYHGYETAERKAKDKYEVDTNMQYNLGYQHGYDSGKDVAYKELSGWNIEEGKAKLKEANDAGHDAGYKMGKDLAWAIAQKIIMDSDHGGYTFGQLEDIFGTSECIDIFSDYTVEEVINMIDTYNASKKNEPTNYDKFIALFPSVTDRDIPRTFYCGENGFFISDSWMNKQYKEPSDGN